MWLGVDTGGTFTDFVLYDGSAIRTHKVLSTAAAPEQAILQGIAELGIKNSQGLRLTHGSTVATNAVLQGRGVKTVYIANQGLKDVILIGRQARAELYNLQPKSKPSLIQPEHCIEVASRLSAQGQTLSRLTEQDLQQCRQLIDQIKPQAVAINLLFSYLDDSDEKRLEAILSDDYFVSRSSAVLSERREYERGMATCLNAYVGPLMKHYLLRLEQALPDASISVMQSHGGTISVEQAASHAVNLLLSGPAGGLKGAEFVASESADKALLSFDMGGTSTDVALIKNQIGLTSEAQIAGYPVAVPMVDMHTIGAGGGSIARLDGGGLLLVGPESAGASPGPACYGNGGIQATVTDANVVLGRIPQQQSLGGYLTIDYQAAETAVGQLASQLGVTLQQAAKGIVQIANEHMVQALRVISIERGEDPKAFTLLSFGGAGGLHICELAEAMDMDKAMIPVHGGVLSALGMLVAVPSREMSHSINRRFDQCSDALINSTVQDLVAQAQQQMKTELAAQQAQVSVTVDVCYSGQSFSLPIKWTCLDEVAGAFHQLHLQRYGHRMQSKLELVTLRVKLQAKALDFELPALKPVRAAASSSVSLYGEADQVAVYERDQLGAGQSINGPALVLEQVASSYIKSGWQAVVDRVGNLLLTRIAAASA
ncbi:MAG: hydantoinase/oxoprolinase family protein [Gammaproteobacteria bacterium]|nr:hydantoinase/oxoprolinase family protein [Gammaproteobacteria bacterium]